jgi:hypothetical protein
MNLPFHPTAATTVNLSAGTTSTNVQIVDGNTSPGALQVRIHNSGTVIAFIRQGADNTVAATVTKGTPIPPGAVEVMTFTVPSASSTGLWVAGITNSGTATVYFTPGTGI